ncbi:MAG: helix-turn-helix domain-containing protein [Burkholderiales bacterium]|nr:helix-turn-helix domain-containing protein [Burkholderiales bacterium]
MSDTGAEDQAAPAGPGTVTRPGRMLAEARMAKGLTLAEVAAQLKLSPSQVAALEADDYGSLPGPVFVRGFIRNYARLLEQDPEQLSGGLDLPNASAPATAALPLSRDIPFPPRKTGSWRPYAAVLLVAVLLATAYEIFYAEPPEVLVSAPPSPAAPAERLAESVNAGRTAELPAGTAGAADVATNSATPETPAAEPGARDERPEPQGQAAPLAAGMAEVHFVFDAASWVEVRDRGERILLSQLNAAGTEQRVTGRPPLSVVVGNAKDVQMTYNGKPFDLAPHTRVEVARFVLE